MIIRKHREKMAMNDVMHARKKLSGAMLYTEKKLKKLNAFDLWKDEEEKKSFDKIKNKCNSIYMINKYNRKIEELSDQQKQLEKEYNKAKQLVIECKKNIKKAFIEYSKRSKEKEKLQEHKKEWIREKNMINQRKKELEVDELNTMRFNEIS
jgi:tryptophanyl-tRNA synthetase